MILKGIQDYFEKIYLVFCDPRGLTEEDSKEKEAQNARKNKDVGDRFHRRLPKSLQYLV
jgi:hypothetical protein